MGFRIALHSVSYAGFFYTGGALPLQEIFEKAKDSGYEGVELMAKRPHGLPCDLDAEARSQIKKICVDTGMEIPIIAGYTNFSYSSAGRREKELVYLNECIKLARDLNVGKVRIFAAGMGELDPQYGVRTVPKYGIQYWRWCREFMTDGAKIAEECGVTLGLQNHRPLMESYSDVLSMIDEVGSPALKAIIDPEYVKTVSIEKAVKESARVLLPHIHLGPTFPEVIEDVKKWFKSAKSIGFDGWISYEVCSPRYERHELVPMSKVDALVDEAARSLRQLITET